MTAMLLHAGLLRQVEAQSPQRRSPASVFSSRATVQEQATGNQIFGVGVNSDAGLTGSVVLNERNSDLTPRCAKDPEVSVEVRFISLSPSCYERLARDMIAPLGDKALFLAGSANFFRKEYKEADLFYSQLVEMSSSPLAEQALKLAIMSKQMSTGRDACDGRRAVAEACLLVDTALRSYPDSATFLDDSQVSRLFNVVQADPRTKVMHTPKMTLGNGQASTLGMTEQHFFVTGVYVTTKNDQIVFLPHNEPFSTGPQLRVQPTVSADRSSIHMKLKASQTELRPGNVQRFPVTSSITPVFEGGAVGAPIPFTQFIQQPNFVTISMEKEVVVPDGRTLLLTGWAKVPQPPDNDEPSALSTLPLVGWLFAKPAEVREEKQLLVLITPRIIGDE
jgi:Flp pilus assembly secretin CpaC